MIDLRKIKARARAATPGPWEAKDPVDDSYGRDAPVVVVESRTDIEFACGNGGFMSLRMEAWCDADPLHIATMDPDTTLQIVEALEACIEGLEGHFGARFWDSELGKTLAEFGIGGGDE